LKTFLTNAATGKGDPTQANRLYVIDQFRNLATLTEHLQHQCSYVMPRSHGTFTLSTVGAISRLHFQAARQAPIFNMRVTTCGRQRRLRRDAPSSLLQTLDWTYHDIDLTLSNTYLSSTVDTGLNGTRRDDTRQQLFDMDARPPTMAFRR